jgi:hypothetical protein
VPVSLDISGASFLPGERATVDVIVGRGAEDLYGAQFQLTFDLDVLQVVDGDAILEGVQVAVGPLLSSDLVETAGPDFVVAQNSAGQGTVAFAIVQLSPAQPADQGGVLASVTFQALAVGRSGLDLVDVVLSDRAGQEIPSNPLGGEISVLSPQTPDPTVTAEAARAPTDTPPAPTLAATTAPSPTAVPAVTVATEPTATPAPAPTPPPVPSSGGLSGGAIAGIIAGIVAGLAAIGAAAFALMRRRAQQAV